MENKVSYSIPALLAMAGQASNGAGLHGAALPLLQNTKANIDTDIAALVDKIMAYGTGKNLLSDNRDTLNTKVAESRLFLTVSRDSFKTTLGFEYNERWDVTGLTSSLAIPYVATDVLLLLRSFKEFLTANPLLEVEVKDITATQAGLLFTQLEAALTAKNQQDSVVSNVLIERDEKAGALRKRMSDLIAELKMRMDGLDTRWKAFGLNLPDGTETPDQVEHLKATLIGPNAAALKWDMASRADYYHVFKKVHGVDDDYILIGSPADLDFTIENLPANAQIEIVVSAVNGGGEGSVSESVIVTTHA